MRVAQLADVAEVHERMYGVQGAVAMARSRRGGQLDPTVVDAFTPDAEALFPAAGDDPWDRALSIAPDSEIRLDEPRLDDLLTAIGDFVDLKCPFTLGHSRSVAALAEAAAVQLGTVGRSTSLPCAVPATSTTSAGSASRTRSGRSRAS